MEKENMLTKEVNGEQIGQIVEMNGDKKVSRKDKKEQDKAIQMLAGMSRKQRRKALGKQRKSWPAMTREQNIKKQISMGIYDYTDMKGKKVRPTVEEVLAKQKK